VVPPLTLRHGSGLTKLRLPFRERARTGREMAELLRLLQTPGLEAVAIVFAAAFLLIRLGHALIGLAEAWDTYQAKRLRRLSKPPGAG
jgi:hypothetical protein